MESNIESSEQQNQPRVVFFEAVAAQRKPLELINSRSYRVR